MKVKKMESIIDKLKDSAGDINLVDLINELLSMQYVELDELDGYDDAMQNAKDEAITDMS